MNIGNIALGLHPVLLAPMEDVTDIGFRLLCKQLGAGMVYSEFVSCDALTRMVNKSLQKLAVCDEERPVAIQIYGKDPKEMARAAKIVIDRSHPDILDNNYKFHTHHPFITCPTGLLYKHYNTLIFIFATIQFYCFQI